MEERAMIERHLTQAEGHVALGERHIARQIEIVAELERDGHEQTAIAARELLAMFEQTHKSHVEDRDRLRAELALLG
jgi:HEAT repeat protein